MHKYFVHMGPVLYADTFIYFNPQKYLSIFFKVNAQAKFIDIHFFTFGILDWKVSIFMKFLWSSIFSNIVLCVLSVTVEHAHCNNYVKLKKLKIHNTRPSNHYPNKWSVSVLMSRSVAAFKNKIECTGECTQQQLTTRAKTQRVVTAHPKCIIFNVNTIRTYLVQSICLQDNASKNTSH